MTSSIKTKKRVILVSPLPPPIGGIASWTESYINYAKKNNIKYHLINSSVVGKRIQTGKVSYKDEIRRIRKLHEELKEWDKREKNIVIHYNASCFTKGLIKDLLVLVGIKAPIVYQCHCNLDTNLNNVVTCVYKFIICIKKAINKLILNPVKRKLVNKCGEQVCFGMNADITGWKNVYIGNDVSIGNNCNFMTTRAKIYIGDHVMFGPAVRIITGNHVIDVPGKYMSEFTDADKREKDDQDVIFKGDNWIGCNAIILKGVTIGYICVKKNKERKKI